MTTLQLFCFASVLCFSNHTSHSPTLVGERLPSPSSPALLTRRDLLGTDAFRSSPLLRRPPSLLAPTHRHRRECLIEESSALSSFPFLIPLPSSPSLFAIRGRTSSSSTNHLHLLAARTQPCRHCITLGEAVLDLAALSLHSFSSLHSCKSACQLPVVPCGDLKASQAHHRRLDPFARSGPTTLARRRRLKVHPYNARFEAHLFRGA